MLLTAFDLVDQLLQLRFGAEADGAAGQGAVFAEQQGSGMVLTPNWAASPRLVINIYLAEFDAGLLCGKLVQYRESMRQGPAPRCPKVNADGKTQHLQPPAQNYQRASSVIFMQTYIMTSFLLALFQYIIPQQV